MKQYCILLRDAYIYNTTNERYKRINSERLFPLEGWG